MIRSCQQSSNCPPFDPVGNFSSEADDTLDYLSRSWDGFQPPPLLREWTATECGVTVVSHLSQLDADQQAKAASILCNQGGQNPDITLFVNEPQRCCLPCPDGSSTCYTVPGGIVVGPNQATADSNAYYLACQLVGSNPVCLGNLKSCCCVGDDYTGTIVANRRVSWSVVGGSIPPGMTLSSGYTTELEISGVPLVPGKYTFDIKGESNEGPYSIKRYSITVLAITTTSLPAYTVGVPYSFQLVATGGSGHYSWKIDSGTLPAGLTLSITGLISGTPL